MEADPLDQGARLELLERRVERLEAELALLRRDAGPAATPAPTAAPATWAPPPAPRAWPSPVAPAARREREPISLDSEVVLKWGGVALVVLAVGFAVSTAISRGWIGPELQLAGAAAVSIGLVVAGLRLRESRPGWTHALCSAGIAAAFTTVASNLFLDQASDAIAFGATVGIGAAGLGLAREVRSEWVGAVALAGAVIGWLVIGRADPPVVASLVWFAVVVAASLALALDQRWFAVRLLAHVAGLIVVLRIGAEAETTVEQISTLIVAALLAASLARIPSIGDSTSMWQQLEIQLVMALAPWGFGVTAITLGFSDETAVGWTAIAAAAAGAALAGVVHRYVRPPHLVSHVVGASIALSIGLAVLLSTTAVFVGFALQGVGLVIIARMFGGNVRVIVNAAIVSIVAAVDAVSEMVEAWSDDARVVDDVSHLVIIVALGVAAWQAQHRDLQRVAAIGILAMVMIWVGSVLVHLPQGQAAVSISWAVLGTAILLAGALRKVPEVGMVGLTVLGVTVAKLLTVDLREVDTLWRAGLFFVVGLGFLRLGFLLPRLTGTAAGRDPSSDTVDDADEPSEPVDQSTAV